MALVARSCLLVRGYIAPRITMVIAIMVSPKLLKRISDSAMTMFIIGCRIIRSHIAPISN